MNVKLLRKVAKHILQEPKRLVMWKVLVTQSKDNPTVDDRPFARCGTAACIAGWTCVLAKTNLEKKTPQNLLDEAERLLGLTVLEAELLFQPTAWPNKFHAGQVDDGKAKTAKVAAARIEHFIKTKGKE